MSPAFGHKMAAGNEVVNGNNFGLSLVMTSAPFDNVHASCRIGETEWCKPLDVYQWTGNIQAELRGKVEDYTDLSWTETCKLFSKASANLKNTNHHIHYHPGIFSYPR